MAAETRREAARPLLPFRVHFAGGDKVDVMATDSADVRRRVEKIKLIKEKA